MTRSYYGGPVIKEPVWTPEIPTYFFTGGLGGASAGLALAAELAGNDVLARRAWAVALGGLGVSPALLISDLGVPRRFLNMLRVFKVTSPMSVGSWLLSGAGTATAIAAANRLLGLFPRALADRATVAAGVLGMPVATYTATLISNTAVPIWHEARRELPFVFAGGAAASAGAAATLATPAKHAGPARRLAIGGVAVEMATVSVMHQRLGELAEPYEEKGAPATLSKVARALSIGGAAAIAAAGPRRPAATGIGAAAVLAGALAERWSIFKAGFASARDPKYTVAPQRRRVEKRAAAA
ncbi:MAG TPA: NrfD/PsrC family molybdoenzyme membrane anchor subunit [Thermoleophilaceae bacterium]